MKSRSLIQTITVLTVVSLCAGFGIYAFVSLNKVEQRHDFDLYALVPQDAVAVVETDRMAALVDDINSLACSRDGHFLYASDLFVYLKNYLHTLVDNTPHGLSVQMNKMLLSFHDPDTPDNQVLYCALGENDPVLVEAFIGRYSAGRFPPKRFIYRDEEMQIYPLADGKFLSAFFTNEFLVLSFQKRLVEQVIDAWKDRRSLQRMESFSALRAGKQQHLACTVYLRTKEVDMGMNGSTTVQRPVYKLGGWVEFDIKLDDAVIYCSGMTQEADTTQSFIATMQRQQLLEEFPGGHLPKSSFLYTHYALSDCESLLDYSLQQPGIKPDTIYYTHWCSFFNEFGAGEVTSCFFLPKDSTERMASHHVLRIPLKEPSLAVQRLNELPAPDAIFARLSGFEVTEGEVCARMYQGTLLLAPTAASITAYIQSMEQENVLEGTPVYEEGMAGLSPTYNFVQAIDMEQMLQQPEPYARLVPNFFFRHAKFFRHFQLEMQLTCTDGVVYPNIVLLYKGG